MAEGIADATLAYAEYLASLGSDAERSQAEAQKRQLVLAQLPDDEIGRPPVRTLGAYLDDAIPDPPQLVKPGLFVRGAITVMSSRGGKGKTAVSLNRLIRWGAGLPLF